MQGLNKSAAGSQPQTGLAGEPPAGHQKVDHPQDGGDHDLDLDGRLELDAKWQIVEIDNRALALLNCRMRALQGFELWDVVSEEISDQHQAETSNALASSPRHAFVAHDKFVLRPVLTG